MIDWYTVLSAVVAVSAGVLALALGLFGRPPGDLTIGGLALSELTLLVQAVISIVLPLAGHPTAGDGVEFAGYLLTAIIVLPAAGFWALLDRTRWSNVIMGAALLTVAVMIYRMDQIWFPVAA